jgi:hypothetical protein
MENVGKALALLCVLSICWAGGIVAQDRADVSLVNVRADHVVVTLPSQSFYDLSEFLKSEFREGWTLIPGNGKGYIFSSSSVPYVKGFIFSSSIGPYVEVWDVGAMAQDVHNPLGYQIAISSTDSEDGKRKAVAYFGHEGLDWARFGAPDLFTIGARYAGGDPLGGTFFVSDGKSPSTLTVGQSPVRALTNIVTTMPQFRMREVETYRAFGFSSRAIKNGVEVKDTSGVTICLLERSNDELFSYDHAALRFRMVQPVAARREVQIGKSKVMKAVFDGTFVWLILRADLFDPSSSNQPCSN